VFRSLQRRGGLWHVGPRGPVGEPALELVMLQTEATTLLVAAEAREPGLLTVAVHTPGAAGSYAGASTDLVQLELPAPALMVSGACARPCLSVRP
jgi:hypothetical protein